MPKTDRMVRSIDERAVNEFTSEALTFLGDGKWNEFLQHMSKCGFDESEVDNLTDEVHSRAGRS